LERKTLGKKKIISDISLEQLFLNVSFIGF